ncbi:MAG: hypothetical protein RIQ79_1770, partial [Verrucomicrobiota bacterium]
MRRPAFDSHSPGADRGDDHALAPAAPSRKTTGRVFLACLLSALAAFALGRATAPTTGRFASAGASPTRSGVGGANSRIRFDSRNGNTRPSGPTSAASDGTLDPIAAKQAEIVALLSRFKDNDQTDLGPELLGLVSWTNSADADGLALLLGSAKALMPESNIY